MPRDSARLMSLVAFGSLVAGLASSAAQAGAAAAGDYNGDGFVDLAIGIPQEDVNGVVDAGAISVIFGSATGLNATTPLTNQFWHRAKSGVAGDLAVSANFGTSLAAGDFNNDGFSDLIVGVPGDATATGSVHIFYGGTNGLKTGNDHIITQNTADVEGNGAPPDAFGTGVASGDFNGDGFFDVAIGSPFDSDGALVAGAVNVIYGAAGGISPTASRVDQLWHQNSTGIDDTSGMADAFGTSLEAGDFNNDGRDDLAIGVPHETVNAMTGAGAVHMLLGSATGLTATGTKFFGQGAGGLAGTAEMDDAFGTALAAGDFDLDGNFDLAIGIPAQAVGGSDNAGAIQILMGGATGLGSAGNKVFHQNSTNIKEQADPMDPGGGVKDGEGFGLALAAGRFNADGVWDLAIGVPNEDLVTSEEGVVHLFFGVQGQGIKASGNKLFKQGANGLLDAAEEGDHFGSSLTAGDFNNDGRDDLAIGVPGEVFGAAENAGMVHVLKNGGTTGNKTWHQNKTSIKDSCETGDSYGAGLAP